MIIDKIFNDSVLTISPKGRIDSVSGDEFSAFIDENLNDDLKKIIFDFADVDFISSKGLRVLVSVYKNLNGKEMEIINAGVSVIEVLRISGLLDKFNVK